MGDGREGFNGFTANFLGGRVVGNDERVLGLDDFEAAVKRIVLSIGEEGGILVVIGAAGCANLIGQLGVFGAQGLGNLCGVFSGVLCMSLGGSSSGGVVLSHPSSLTCWGADLPRRCHGGSSPAGFPRTELTPASCGHSRECPLKAGVKKYGFRPRQRQQQSP